MCLEGRRQYDVFASGLWSFGYINFLFFFNNLIRVLIFLMKFSSGYFFLILIFIENVCADVGTQQIKMFASTKVYARLCTQWLLRFTKGVCAEMEIMFVIITAHTVSRIPDTEQLYGVLKAMRILLIQ